MDTENTKLDIEFGKATEEEWQTYYKVRRIRTSWDIASFLHWGIEPHFMSIEEIKKWYKEEHDEDWEPVTRNEFLFMCEYMEEYFTIDSTMQELMEDAYEIVRNIRKNNYSGITEGTMKMVSRTILLERYFPDELKDKLNGGDK